MSEPTIDQIPDHRNTTRDLSFRLRVAAASSFTYLTGAMTALLVDPHLGQHVAFGARVYPAWAYWVFPIFAVLIFVSTFVTLAKTSKSYRIYVVTIPVWVFAIPTFWVLKPEIPHMAVLSEIGIAAIVTTVAVWIHYCHLESGYLRDDAILPDAKIERVKEEIAFWRNGGLAALGGFLALLVSWYSRTAQLNQQMSTNPREQVLLNISGLVFILVQSSWYVFGPVAEFAVKTRQALRLLEEVPNTAEKAKA
jgi:hypothetical protein